MEYGMMMCCVQRCMHAMCIYNPCPKFLFLTSKSNTDITQESTVDVKLFLSGIRIHSKFS